RICKRVCSTASNSSEVRYTVIFSLCRTRPLAGADDCADDWSEDWTEDWTEDSDCSGDDVGPKISSAPGIFTRLGIAATPHEPAGDRSQPPPMTMRTW